jgi:hypothetical protein
LIRNALIIAMSSLVLVGTTVGIGKPHFAKGERCRLVSGPLFQQGEDQEVCIEDTGKAAFGLSKIEEAISDGFPTNEALLTYTLFCCSRNVEKQLSIQTEYRGPFYYGKIGSQYHCFHPSWLDKK